MFGATALSGMQPHEASQLVGMVFQNPNLQLINQTVQSEVAFGPENLALPQPEIAARVEWCLDVTGMAGMRKAAVVTLSGGQKQRTAIAATLAMRPRILVLDEPLSDLDPVGAQEVLATLQRLARDGGTGVVIVEHRVDEVAPWADRVVLMDDGRVVLDQPPRTAWAERGPWLATGVGIPDTVRLAHAVPEAFGSALPLSVEEAAEAVRDTWFPAALAAAAARRRRHGRPALAGVAGRPAGQARPAAPRRTARVNSRHSPGVHSSAGPAGFLLSRSATRLPLSSVAPGMIATSTQAPPFPLLKDDLRQAAPVRSISRSPSSPGQRRACRGSASAFSMS